MTTEISVMYGSEKVNPASVQRLTSAGMAATGDNSSSVRDINTRSALILTPLIDSTESVTLVLLGTNIVGYNSCPAEFSGSIFD